MSDVFKTITVTAANRSAAVDLVRTLYPEQTPFVGQRTTLQGGTVATHYLMSGDIPQDMAALFAPDGPGAELAADYSDEGWMAVCARLGLYPVYEEI